jgi:hypothetical protein
MWAQPGYPVLGVGSGIQHCCHRAGFGPHALVLRAAYSQMKELQFAISNMMDNLNTNININTTTKS